MPGASSTICGTYLLSVRDGCGWLDNGEILDIDRTPRAPWQPCGRNALALVPVEEICRRIRRIAQHPLRRPKTGGGWAGGFISQCEQLKAPSGWHESLITGRRFRPPYAMKGPLAERFKSFRTSRTHDLTAEIYVQCDRRPSVAELVGNLSCGEST